MSLGIFLCDSSPTLTYSFETSLSYFKLARFVNNAARPLLVTVHVDSQTRYTRVGDRPLHRNPHVTTPGRICTET